MSDASARTAREEWGTRFGFLMAMLGAMVGAGNIWRMPYTTGQNGGGVFLIAYVLLLFVIAIPGLMAETMLGRYTQKGVIGSFRQILGNKQYAGLALVVVLVNVALMSYYAPVIGWSMYYAGQSLLPTFFQSGFEASAFWDSFVGSPLLTIGAHTVVMAAIAIVLTFGIKKGIERVVKYMIPFLILSLIAISIRGVTLSGGMDGLAFAFTPDWSYLFRGDMWVAALGQALFSTGLGWGIALTYGSYLRKHDDVALGGGVFTALGNTAIGLLAIFAVFPVVFAFGLEPTAGANLMFISLVQVFPQLVGLLFRDVLVRTRDHRSGRDDDRRTDATEQEPVRADGVGRDLAARPAERLLVVVPRLDGLHLRELRAPAGDARHHRAHRLEAGARTGARPRPEPELGHLRRLVVGRHHQVRHPARDDLHHRLRRVHEHRYGRSDADGRRHRADGGADGGEHRHHASAPGQPGPRCGYRAQGG